MKQIRHIIDTRDETYQSLCGNAGVFTCSTSDPLAAAVRMENEGHRLCGNCKRIVRLRFGSIARWDREDARKPLAAQDKARAVAAYKAGLPVIVL